MTDPKDRAWAGDRVTRWLRQAPGLERQLAPVSQVLFDAAAIRPGEAVLDVGCGTGPTTVGAALRSGPEGRVTGLDVSAEMLAAARRAADLVHEPHARLDWLEQDVSSWTVGAPEWDVALSRFGVMFFPDPPAALHNLATATRAGGRFAAAVWALRPQSPLFEVTYRIAYDTRVAHGDTPRDVPPDEGPFSWHDDRYVTGLLGDAGWRDVRIDTHRLRLPYAGAVDALHAAEAAVDFGPTREVLLDADPAVVHAAREAMVAAFGADHLDEHGNVVLDATVRIVTARR